MSSEDTHPNPFLQQLNTTKRRKGRNRKKYKLKNQTQSQSQSNNNNNKNNNKSNKNKNKSNNNNNSNIKVLSHKDKSPKNDEIVKNILEDPKRFPKYLNDYQAFIPNNIAYDSKDSQIDIMRVADIQDKQPNHINNPKNRNQINPKQVIVISIQSIKRI